MQLTYKYAWIIPLLPSAIAAIIGLSLLIFRNATKNLRSICAFLNISTLGIAMMLSLVIFWEQTVDNSSHIELWSWISNQSITLQIGYIIDPLSSIMLVLVTTVGVVVMIYTDGYMNHDKAYVRFFTYLSLFTASMLGLVLSPNLIQIYFFWELVGMCSYLLIGFWVSRPSAASACQKAFITNRIGDFGLLLGILGLYSLTNSFDFSTITERIHELIQTNEINQYSLFIFCLLLFMGPIAKSAQFPLHVWLPDAMEGPTPISALIHAATMVAAGIFLVARLLPLFETIPVMMDVIACIGTLTAFLGATLALSQKDLKRGLAYSTMSQLGYMMLAMGIGSYQAGIFHLITHAYSKALLFLGAGSVIHGVEPIVGYNPDRNQDMAYMGGIRKYMPITGITFLIGTLSLCGIPPFACFWSKDEILAESWHKFPLLGIFSWLTAGLTAFYMFRIYFLTFEGTFRGIDLSKDNQNVHGEKKVIHPHESSVSMVVPLVALCIPTIFIGLIGAPFYIKGSILGILPQWLHILPFNDYESVDFDLTYFVIESLPSIGISCFGIIFAWFVYSPQAMSTRNVYKSLDPIVKGKTGLMLNFIYNWSLRRGYIDDLYNNIFINFTRNLSKSLSFFDQWIIDGSVNSTGIITLFIGESTRYGEIGKTNSYVWILTLGLTILIFIGLKQ